MAIFTKSLNKLLKHEGGYLDDPDDRGGATKFGITHKTLAAWRGETVDAEDVKNMTVTEASAIYKARYWDEMTLNGIVSQELAGAVMDFGVNAGPKTSIKAMQRAANWVQKNRKRGELVVDGDIGPITRRFVNTTDDRALLVKFFQERIRYYAAIAKHRPANRKFLYAWTRRALDHV